MTGWIGNGGRSTAMGGLDEVMGMTVIDLTVAAPATGTARGAARAWLREMVTTVQAYRPVEGIARRPIMGRQPVRGESRSFGAAVWPDGARVQWPIGEGTSRR